MKLLRRYAPALTVAVIVAAIIATVAVSGGSSRHRKSASPTLAGPAPVILDAANRTSVDWGPNCDPKTGRVRIPTLYAAPCVKPYAPAQGNGGATAPGVTSNAINVVLYIAANDPTSQVIQGVLAGAGANDTTAQSTRTAQDFVDLFARYYETYGRRIHLEFLNASGGFNDDAAARADAIRAATDLKAFAVVGGPLQSSAFADTLAAHHVLCIQCVNGQPESWAAARAPYVYPQASIMRGLVVQAQWLLEEVAGHKAAFAGSADLRAKARTFGIVNYDTPDGGYGATVKLFKRQLARGGVKLASQASYTFDIAKAQESATTLVTKMKRAGVTTVIFAGDPIEPIYLTKEATAQNYFPEWIVTGTLLTDTDVFARLYDPRQWSHAFGLVWGPVRTPRELFDAWHLYEWAFGKPPPAPASVQVLEPPIWELFTGIHLAGPRLDAASFRAGLFRFPATGGGPTRPRVAFGEHFVGGVSLSGNSDASEVWYDATEVGVDEVGRTGAGMYRWSDDGRRYQAGEVPARPTHAFGDAGSVAILDRLPASDRPPEYPRPPSPTSG